MGGFLGWMVVGVWMKSSYKINWNHNRTKTMSTNHWHKQNTDWENGRSKKCKACKQNAKKNKTNKNNKLARLFECVLPQSCSLAFQRPIATSYACHCCCYQTCSTADHFFHLCSLLIAKLLLEDCAADRSTWLADHLIERAFLELAKKYVLYITEIGHVKYFFRPWTMVPCTAVTDL